MNIDITKTLQAVEIIAEQLGIDLTAYGNASPTKLILAALQSSVQILQETTQIAITEQNPLTATDIKSRLGLAALVGLNPATLFHAASGKVTVQTNQTIVIGQHAKLMSYDNVDYYVVLPTETVQFSSDTDIQVRQGILKQQNFTATGEPWESFILYADNYVDCDSIEVYYGSKRLTVGYKLDEQADCYVRPNYSGDIEVIIDRAHTLPAGAALTVIYGDCIGIDGDNIQAGQYLIAKEFAYSGDTDVSDTVKVVISEPIIGGTDFEAIDADLSNSIMLAGHNNLIGTEAQLLQYVKQFKQYSIQSCKLTNGVFAINALRSLQLLTKTMDYWTACQNLTLRSEDIVSLNEHLNKHSKKSLELVISVKHAIQEQCKVNVTVNMNTPAPDAIQSIVVQYLLDKQNANAYDVATLYKQLIAVPGVTECNVSFSGNVNEYGTAVPFATDAALICSAATIAVNGIGKTFGTWTAPVGVSIDATIDNVATNRIVSINDEL